MPTLSALTLASFSALACAFARPAAGQDAPPRLAVVVVVDQMRPDHLTRYAGFYTGGLATLLREGAVFTDAHQDHAVTETAVGHAAIVTGVRPVRHGIVGTIWYDRRARRTFYASEDTAVVTVGLPGEPGRSPSQLRHSTVGDWLKDASPASKVYAVALKDRAATFMGGRKADAAIWYLEDVGKFVTSSYYRVDSLPWLSAFNASGRIESYYAGGWQPLLPPEGYFVSREDSFPTEADGVRVTFPHRFGGDSTGPGAAYYGELRASPFGDELTLAVARLVVEQYALGRDAAPDLLFIGCSAADYIGHSYGPLSEEAQDYYLRLDAMLGELLRFLDERVGRANYYLVLSSDHGVLPMPEDLKRRGFPAGRVSREDLQLAVQEAVLGALRDAGVTETPRLRLANGLVLEFDSGAVTDAQLAVVRRGIADRMRAAPFVADAYTYEELRSGGDDRPFLELYRHQFPEDLSPDVALRYAPLYIVGWDYGTTHGAPYAYDTHIPLILFGPGVRAARHERRVRSVDIAPTLARILRIPAPQGLDGEVLPEALAARR
jgi:predicted AlkP superfamily pyrophosphatase or phosphodiesterase